MSVLQNKVHFYSMFTGRGCQLYDPTQDRFYETEEINTFLFRDSGLKDGSELQLKPAPKKENVASVESEENKEQEPLHIDTGGNRFDEDQDASIGSSEAIRQAMLKLAEEGEEGECDMQEEGEEEMVESEVYPEGNEAEQASIAEAPADEQ